MSNQVLSVDVAKTIVELKQIQEAIAKFYRTSNYRYQESYEGKKEITKLRFRLDQKMLILTSSILADFGDMAQKVISEGKSTPEDSLEEFVNWVF